MRFVLVHPNYHSGGAESAGSWPPAWVAFLAGARKAKGVDDIHFIDAMTMNVAGKDLRAKLVALQPDVIGATSIILPEAGAKPPRDPQLSGDPLSARPAWRTAADRRHRPPCLDLCRIGAVSRGRPRPPDRRNLGQPACNCTVLPLARRHFFAAFPGPRLAVRPGRDDRGGPRQPFPAPSGLTLRIMSLAICCAVAGDDTRQGGRAGKIPWSRQLGACLTGNCNV
jgi:hypothetical protein